MGSITLLVAVIVLVLVLVAMGGTLRDKIRERRRLREYQEAQERAWKNQREQKEREVITYRNASTRYTKLQDMLEKKDFVAADNETLKIMRYVANRAEEAFDYFRQEDIMKFPCEDLKIIDSMWNQSSNGRFGFSAQMEIWERRGKPNPSNFPPRIDYMAFGWNPYMDYGPNGVRSCLRVSPDITQMPRGYLPFACLIWIECVYYGSPGLQMVQSRGPGLYIKDMEDRLNDGLTILIKKLESCGF